MVENLAWYIAGVVTGAAAMLIRNLLALAKDK